MPGKLADASDRQVQNRKGGRRGETQEDSL